MGYHDKKAHVSLPLNPKYLGMCLPEKTTWDTKINVCRMVIGIAVSTYAQLEGELEPRRAGVLAQTVVRQLDNLKFLNEQGSCYADGVHATRVLEAGTSWDLILKCTPTTAYIGE